jgi:hypothetical protein
LKLKHDEALSNYPFKFNLRHYIKALIKRQQGQIQESLQLFQAATVGRCSFTLSNPR